MGKQGVYVGDVRALTVERSSQKNATFPFRLLITKVKSAHAYFSNVKLLRLIAVKPFRSTVLD